jgi:hypothetical protein
MNQNSSHSLSTRAIVPRVCSCATGSDWIGATEATKICRIESADKKHQVSRNLRKGITVTFSHRRGTVPYKRGVWLTSWASMISAWKFSFALRETGPALSATHK